MSRLGKLPIKLPAGVSAIFKDSILEVKGPKGVVKVLINSIIDVKISAEELNIAPKNMEEKNASAMWGLAWSLSTNAVVGVSEGFTKKLEINGVGYRVAVSGSKLTLNLGYSNPIEFPLPEGISATVEGNSVTIIGIDKQAVGEVAAQIRKLRKPEPYKGKGVKYEGEIIRRKAGKSATKGK